MALIRTPNTYARPTPWIALILVVAGALAFVNRETLRGLLGPPAASLAEAYDEKPGGPTVDHAVFDALLKQIVDDRGGVDYAALAAGPGRLDAYIASLAEAPFDALGRDEKLALLINAYNAFTLRLILDYWDGGKLESIKDIPGHKRWDASRWRVGSFTWSLNAIEHEQVRPKFKEPRVHFALVCAAVGCPKLRNEAYLAARIDGQLEDQARYAHTHDRWFRFEPDRQEVHLTRLYNWYGGDFEQVAGSVLEYAAQYSDELKRVLAAGGRPRVRWLPYDWSLNDRSNAK